MKHILLPTDFSLNAKNAINYAVYLFEREPCTFYVLNAFQVSPSGLSSKINKERDTRLYSITKEESERGLKELMEQLNCPNKSPVHIFESLSVSDSLRNALGRTVLKKHIDYIFMGTKGSSSIKEIFMGSNAIDAIEHLGACPVIAVPKEYSFDLPDEIAFATDFRHFYENKELFPLIALAKLWNSTIEVVYIDEGKEGSANQKTAKKLLKNKLKDVKTRFLEIAPSSSISSVVKKLNEKNINIGMIAMIKREHGYFQKLIREPIIKKVAYKTEIPFLVLPEYPKA